MPLDIADIQDAYMSGQADFQEWKEEFESQFFRPLTEEMIMLYIMNMNDEQINSLPPEVQTAVRQLKEGVVNGTRTQTKV